MNFETGFIKDCIKRLTYYKDLADKTFAQLDEHDMLYQPNEESNSIAMVVQHMAGNMLSRFTNFLTEDGEKTWRNRDAEFETRLSSKTALLSLWEKGWACVFDALDKLQPADLTKTIYIRSEPLPVYDALLRQLAHYPHHIGQILYIGKMRKGAAWQTLSIPRGASNAFNEQMSAAQKP